MPKLGKRSLMHSVHNGQARCSLEDLFYIYYSVYKRIGILQKPIFWDHVKSHSEAWITVPHAITSVDEEYVPIRWSLSSFCQGDASEKATILSSISSGLSIPLFIVSAHTALSLLHPRILPDQCLLLLKISGSKVSPDFTVLNDTP